MGRLSDHVCDNRNSHASRSMCVTPMVSWRCLIVGFLCHALGYLLFAKGFFPIKIDAPGLNDFAGLSPFSSGSKAQFHKLIFVVVDAMRADFMYSDDSEMSFLHELIKEGTALPFTAYSNPPTVTLPRLKGITGGGLPSFVDAIFNVAENEKSSSEVDSSDSWLAQMRLKKKVMHFFGDDTWLKLFPPSDFFDVYEGTSSFFVSDFHEVDSNVTRHLQSELSNPSWDALILHYLGLDHIGHKGGPSSPFMKPKQREMDNVLKLLYTLCAKNSNDTLIVLLGDHGMNEIGNHGGSSLGETNPGLALISPRFHELQSGQRSPLPKNDEFKYYKHVSQIDLVPTISALFDIPIPKNNVGIIIRDILALWTELHSAKRVLLENCRQFLTLLTATSGKSDSYLSQIRDSYDLLADFDQRGVEDYYDFLSDIQGTLTKKATKYSYPEMAIGVFLIILSLVLALLSLFLASGKRCTFSYAKVGFTIFSIIFSIHFHGSSLIEEEHQLWWLFMMLCIIATSEPWSSQNKLQFLTALVALRVLRSWENTGKKYLMSFTFASILKNNVEINWILVVLTYTTFAVKFMTSQLWGLHSSSSPSAADVSKNFLFILSSVAISAVSILSIIFKTTQLYIDGIELPPWLKTLLFFVLRFLGEAPVEDMDNLQIVNRALSCYFFSALLAIAIVRLVAAFALRDGPRYTTEISDIIPILLLHQSRPEHIPVFLVFNLIKTTYMLLQHSSVQKHATHRLVMLVYFTLCMQNLSFFSLGSTNLLATVDLSNAYNGIGHYEIHKVGLLTFLSNFSGPLYWSLAALEMFLNIFASETKADKRRLYFVKLELLLVFYSVAAFNLVSSCINLRYHLFIWSVFSPKLLFFAIWSLVVNMCVESAIFLPIHYLAAGD